VTVAANAGAARTGTAMIAGRTLTVNQAQVRCDFRVRPREIDINSDARVLRIEVSTAHECSWTAVSNDDWIRVFWGASGTGDGEVVVGVGENEGKTRRGTLTIAGETVRIEQRRDDE
jgi:hypothetical protein